MLAQSVVKAMIIMQGVLPFAAVQGCAHATAAAASLPTATATKWVTIMMTMMALMLWLDGMMMG
jgi:hypothetical protein